MYVLVPEPILLSTTIQNIGEDNNTPFSPADIFSARALSFSCCFVTRAGGLDGEGMGSALEPAPLPRRDRRQGSTTPKSSASKAQP